jgi:hypothetical protein
LPTPRWARPLPRREKLLIISRPLSQAEALEQIEQVGHDFFIYLDSADSTLKVVYRRK